jgi:hypothetical protein
MTNKPNTLPFATPLQIASETKRFPPVNRCIYCGAYSNQLELEHVLPFGIAGNAMLLPKASCRTCASITGQIEQACLRHLWWPFRTRIGAPTGSKRPETFTLRRVKRPDDGKQPISMMLEKPILLGTSQVSAEEYPLNYVALLLPPPGILVGRPPTDDFEGQFWAAYNVDEVKQHIGEGEGMLMGRISPNIFARMLAKIAYAYTVGVKGYGAFKPLVLDLILGKTETANYWVGGDLELPPISQDPVLHNISMRRCTVNGGKTYHVVSLQLFAFLQSPLYHIVIAEAVTVGAGMMDNQGFELPG